MLEGGCVAGVRVAVEVLDRRPQLVEPREEVSAGGQLVGYGKDGKREEASHGSSRDSRVLIFSRVRATLRHCGARRL